MLAMERFGYICIDGKEFQAQEDLTSNKTDENNETRILASVISSVQKCKSLKELGKCLPLISGLGKWKDWEIDYWDKNGEARFYLRKSGLKRGYFKVQSCGLFDGTNIIEKRGDNFPRVTPFLPSNMEPLPKRGKTLR